MDLRPDMSVGDRIKVARKYVDQTQEQLAAAADIDVDTIRKLEQNQRQSCRVSTASALARALGVDTTALLLGVPEDVEQNDPQMQQIRQALIPATDFAPPTDVDDEDTPPELPALRAAVEDSWSSYHSGDFDALDETLPGLITEARIAIREYTNGESAAAHGVLAKALQLGAHTMVQNHYEDLALLGLDRARAAADHSGDQLLPAMMMNSVAWIFLRTGRLKDSEHVAVVSSDSIEPTFRNAPPEHVAVYGGLLLSGMTAAARDRRYDTARELLAVARAAAARVGEEAANRWTTVFGPTSVAMQAVQLETAAGEWGNALKIARKVPLSNRTPVSWQVRFLLDVAHAQAETHRDAEATETLRTVRKLAPRWIRKHGLAVAVTRELLGRPRRPRGITALADFLGIAY